MSRTISITSFVSLSLTAGLIGCSGAASTGGVAAELSALPSSAIVGKLAYGQTSQPVRYTSSPRYRAFSFSGRAGDNVQAWVRSSDGDAVGWILSSSFRTLASNDDAAAGTSDSEVTLSLPSSGTFYVAFDERDLADATFTVSLGLAGGASGGGGSSGGGGAPPPAGCTIDGQTVAAGASASGNACLVCTPALSTSGWSPAADGTSCAGGICAAGQCENGCIIDGSVVPNGNYSLSNQCQSCNASKSTTSWTTLDCGNYGRSCYQGARCCIGANGPYTCEDWGESSTRRYNGENGITESDGCGGDIICY